MGHHDYANPSALVDADWAQEHLSDPNVRFVEVDVDTTAYEQSHLRGAVGWNWTSQLADGTVATSRRRRTWASCCRRADRPGHTIVLYGDNNNRFAAWAYWQLKLFGLRDVRILNGGCKYWLDNGLPVTTDVPSYQPTGIQLGDPDPACAFRDDTCRGSATRPSRSVDVRSPAEFNGEVIAPPGMSETAQRAGQYPGAASIPWAQTVPRGTEDQEPRSSLALRGQGHRGRQGHHRLLPDRRAVEPLVVRPPRAARLPARPELRRQLDRVRQPGRRADREPGGAAGRGWRQSRRFRGVLARYRPGRSGPSRP